MKSGRVILIALVLASAGFACRDASGEDDGFKPDIAAALKSFMEAFVNNDEAALPALLSKDCTTEEVAQLQSGSQLLHEVLLGGQLQLTVDADSLIVKVEDNTAAVPPDQPAGALAATFTVNGQPGPYEHPLAPFEAAPLEFVREGGAWKVHNCGALFQSGDDTPAAAIP